MLKGWRICSVRRRELEAEDAYWKRVLVTGRELRRQVEAEEAEEEGRKLPLRTAQRKLALHHASDRKLSEKINMSHRRVVSERFPCIHIPLRYCLLTPALQWQSRGRRRTSQGCDVTGNRSR